MYSFYSIGPKPDFYTYNKSTQNWCVSGICNINTNVVSAKGIPALPVVKKPEITRFSEYLEYSEFKKYSLKILENYLYKKNIKDKEKCLEIIQSFDDDSIHNTVVFLNNKNRKKSLSKYLTQVRKKILDAPFYVY